MSTGTRTQHITGSSLERTERLRRLLTEAEAIVIGAGSGLSAAAGLTYSGPRFEAKFADFIARYHYTDMYSAGFYPYPSQEEYWAYWSRHIYWNRYFGEIGAPYRRLLELVKDRDYFVITTNVDHCFQRVGFDKKRLFYVQGDYGLWQCGRPCHDKTYDNRDAVLRMFYEQAEMRIPASLIPRCPVCGGPMTMNLRCDDAFVQDAGWYRARDRYKAFLSRQAGRRILLLELGVGWNTPGIIKYPFWRMAARDDRVGYVCINRDEARCPQEIADRALCIDREIGAVLQDLVKLCETAGPR